MCVSINNTYLFANRVLFAQVYVFEIYSSWYMWIQSIHCNFVQYFTAWITLSVLVPWWGMAGFHLFTITSSAAWELLHVSCGHLQSLNVLVCGVFSGYTVEAILSYFLYGQNAFHSLRNCQITFQGICTFYISPSSVCECLLLQSLPTLGIVSS